MNTDNNRDYMVTVREMAYALRRQHMNHALRRRKMSLMSDMLATCAARHTNSDFGNTCQAIASILYTLVERDSLTHSEVKTGLSLVEDIAKQRIQDWYVPSRQADDVGDLPF